MAVGRHTTSIPRRITQSVILCAFLVLFITTTYRGGTEIHYPINLFFQADPLAAAGTMLASRTLNAFFLPVLLVLLATLLLGRFFCGWFCPMGALLDTFRPLMKPVDVKKVPSRNLKYYLLFLLLVTAAFSINLVGIFDPISILIRSLTLSVYPLLSAAAFAVFDQLYYWDIPGVTAASEAVYGVLRETVLPFRQGFFLLSTTSLVLFGAILFAEKIRPRFWCRYLCPLGALLSLFAGVSLLRRRPTGLCPDCAECNDVCETGAFDDDGNFLKGECILTMSCVRSCEKKRAAYTVGFPPRASAPSLVRRHVVTSLVAGLALSPLLLIHPKRKLKESLGIDAVIRPPGAREEPLFLSRCVKCGECMMVCPTGGLQPDLVRGGLEGMYSPILVPRIGYCEYHCTLCGQVCPTGAIEKLSVAEKLETVIGMAYIDTNRCLPYAHGINCMVCEEHCPTADKAIKFREPIGETSADGSQLKQPYVINNLCVGCGICENKCPVGGSGAIIVTSEKAKY
ncbi:MAG: 4Fe-4S binding protein [Deltaproteobacteria bacterium]|nr:4Fe-4S binding protein [Candidatus Zymogenaceae bacterium]